ncbi:MAG TPA: hypothetical protein VHZ03_53660 [Trebonia sp.]|jgi:hypothetical protein|nr:hypothetical protein [Trebonia sp.]
MPGTDEDILRDLMQRATSDVRIPAGVASPIVTRLRHRRWRNRALSAGVAGVAAGTVAGLIAASGPASPSGGGTQAHASGAPVSSAPVLKLTAAQRAIYQLSSAAAESPRPSGRYVALAEKDDSGGQRSQRTTIFDGRTGEGWTYQEGAGIPSTFPPEKHASLTEAQFDAIPTGTTALRAYLIEQATQQAAAALKAEEQQVANLPKPEQKAILDAPQPVQSDDDQVFEQATGMLWNPLVGPALRSALYKVLATTPGVQVNANARDLSGRPAIEISRPNYAVGEVVATFEDPGNGSVLESLWDYPGNMGVGAVSYTISGLYLSVTSSSTLPADPYGN